MTNIPPKDLVEIISALREGSVSFQYVRAREVARRTQEWRDSRVRVLRGSSQGTARYYEALEASSDGWHEGRHDLLPWVEYTMGVLLAAYRELEARVDAVAGARGAKREMVVDGIERLPAEFSIADIERVCPHVSRPTINRVLRDLRRAGRLEVTRGRDAKWTQLT